jgi:hypothetical protein
MEFRRSLHSPAREWNSGLALRSLLKQTEDVVLN